MLAVLPAMHNALEDRTLQDQLEEYQDYARVFLYKLFLSKYNIDAFIKVWGCQ